MMKRTTLAAGLAAVAVTAATSVGAYTLVHAQPPTESPQLPAANVLAEKLDSVSSPRPSADVKGDNVSGEGPAPQALLDPRGFGPNIIITNNVTEVAGDGPSRLVATRTIKYVFPNGKVVETQPGKVPFVREADGEWRVDRAYLCGKRAGIANLGREKGHDVKPDPGCP